MENSKPKPRPSGRGYPAACWTNLGKPGKHMVDFEQAIVCFPHPATAIGLLCLLVVHFDIQPQPAYGVLLPRERFCVRVEGAEDSATPRFGHGVDALYPPEHPIAPI